LRHSAKIYYHIIAFVLCVVLYCIQISVAAPAKAVTVTFAVDAGLLNGPKAQIPSLTDRIRFMWTDANGARMQDVDFRALLKAKAGKGNKDGIVRIPVEVAAEGYLKFRFEAANGIYGVVGRGEAVVSVKRDKDTEHRLNIGLLPYKDARTKLQRRYFVCEILLRENAVNREKGYVTRRWPGSVIDVEGAGMVGVKEALREWEKALGGRIHFRGVEKIGAEGIRFVEEGAVDAQGRPGCGNVDDYESFRYMTVHLAEEGFQSCPPRIAIVMHELGHSLGFAGHTYGLNTIMEYTDSGWRDFKTIDAATADTMRLLYSYPPGTRLSAMGCKGF